MSQRIPRPEASAPDRSYVEAYSATSCYFESLENVINPGLCQADLPHLLHFALKNKEKDYFVKVQDDKSRILVPLSRGLQGIPKELNQCIAEEVYECREGPPETSIEFIDLCPDPYIFSTGPHRALMGIMYEGERYVMAFEEAKGVFQENLFIAAYTEEGRRRVEGSYGYAVDIVKAAVRTVAGVELFRPVHDFTITLFDSPFDILREGCTASPSLFEF